MFTKLLIEIWFGMALGSPLNMQMETDELRGAHRSHSPETTPGAASTPAKTTGRQHILLFTLSWLFLATFYRSTILAWFSHFYSITKRSMRSFHSSIYSSICLVALWVLEKLHPRGLSRKIKKLKLSNLRTL